MTGLKGKGPCKDSKQSDTTGQSRTNHRLAGERGDQFLRVTILETAIVLDDAAG